MTTPTRVFDAHTTQFIAVPPEVVLDFVMDIERYAEIDEKIRPVLWVRRERNLTEFAFRPRLGGLRGTKMVAQERLTPGERVDIVMSPAPHNRLIRVVTHYEGSFECTPVPGGTEVLRSERFAIRTPFRWFMEPFLRRTMPRLVREELQLAKDKLEREHSQAR
ncbi:SRPBCC family protein [Antrihabitans spumae]|uniref:SRPBCC family protein n=1 Tax=Antrihabitans spumae TaxID=3373370 RepID=A0ABW7KTB1_9NOCA